MQKNMGPVDRIFRVLIAILIVVSYWQGFITGTLSIVLLVVSGIFLLTSILSSCPCYSIIGMNTCKVKDNE